MSYAPHNPLIVQSDRSVLVEAMSPRHDEARDALVGFAELVKSPEYLHTWRLTPLSLWNAAAAGHRPEAVVDALRSLAKYPVPDAVIAWIGETMGRFGQVRLVRDGEDLRLVADDPTLLAEVASVREIHDLVQADGDGLRVHPRRRGMIKQALLAAGRPVHDLVGYEDGDALRMALTDRLPDGRPWSLRDYQIDAIDAFSDGPYAGSGVVVLPCGAGKTLVGIGAMVRLGMRTLILCSGTTALEQWRREILARTTLTDDDVGAYTAERKALRPVTLTTYQLLTWRRSKLEEPAHFQLFHQARWGLVLYDEVHLLPAPVFRESAHLQARRRLGLTATLVREDGREGDVFALIGPKRYDRPWRELELQGWIAQARCVEVRVPLGSDDRLRYIEASKRDKVRVAAQNARKLPEVERLIARHDGEQILLLGTWLEHLQFVARRLGVPVVSGETPAAERERAFASFRSGELRVLALSKVGNFSVDLPGASVAIQISGSFGSRQEEAQRLGRVLRPHPDGRPASFYTLVTPETIEQEHAERRQLFLAEQGYPYRVERAGEGVPCAS
jgi:DNA excision repair protein ERCC-3